MLDIVLFNPPSPWLINDRVEAPLGLLYLAGYIRQCGFKVEIVDLSGGVYNVDYDIPEARYYGIGFVSAQFCYAQDILRKCKSKYPDTLIIAGGIHATCMPEECFVAGFDVVLGGEAETNIVDLLYYQFSIVIPHKKITGFNRMPFLNKPAWDLIDLESYLTIPDVVSSYMGHKREINIMGSRGCSGKCAYCTKYKGPLRYREVADIIEEISLLRENYNVERFFFVDDNLIVNQKWLFELCNHLSYNKVEWHCLGRADQLSLKKAVHMQNSGCTGIDFGIESGSQKILDIIQKGCTVQQQEQGLKNAHEAGLKVRAQFMVGLPQESQEDHEKNLQFIERNNRNVDKWGIHIFVPLPSCEIWENPEKFGYQIDKDTDFSNYHTIGKPGQWNFKPAKNAAVIANRRDEILKLIGEKNIYVE